MQLQTHSQNIGENSFRSCIRRELVELHNNTENAIKLDSEIPDVPETAYNDALFLLEVIFNSNIPIPNINATKQGSLTLKWHTADGTANMDLCGNGLVVYHAFSDEDRKDEGACQLSDTAALDELFGALRCIL